VGGPGARVGVDVLHPQRDAAVAQLDLSVQDRDPEARRQRGGEGRVPGTEFGPPREAAKELLAPFVEVLRHAGYLEMVADPADRRARLICPTGKGLAAGQAIRQAVGGLEERWAAGIGPAGWAQLRRTLAQLASSAQTPAG
jgi:hypothetical protein